MNYKDVVMVLDGSVLVRECRNSNNHNIVSYFNYTDETVTVVVDGESFNVSHVCLLGDEGISLFVPVGDGFIDFDVGLIGSLVVD